MRYCVYKKKVFKIPIYPGTKAYSSFKETYYLFDFISQ